MSALDSSVDPTIRLAENLRRRARAMRRFGYLYVGAIIALIVGAALFYYFVPIITDRQQRARIEAIQASIVTQDGIVRAARQEFAALQQQAVHNVFTSAQTIGPAEPLALSSVAFADAQRGWAVGEGGTILATSNGGTNWVPQASGTNATLGGVSFADAQRGWAVGPRGTILATSNGGTSWAPQASGTDQDLKDAVFADPLSGWAVGEGGTILVTADGGANWAPQVSGTTERLFGVAFANAQRGWAVGVGGTILATGDGGANWAPQESATDADLFGVIPRLPEFPISG
jgi:hypothetical protein